MSCMTVIKDIMVLIITDVNMDITGNRDRTFIVDITDSSSFRVGILKQNAKSLFFWNAKI
jgi:hypothetical protein